MRTGFLRKHGFRYLYLIDATTLLGLMVAITTVRFGLDWPTYPLSHYAVGFAVATGLHMAVYYFGGPLRVRAAARPYPLAATSHDAHPAGRWGPAPP